MEHLIAFETYLFDDDKSNELFEIIDVEYFVDILILLPSIRPLWIEKAQVICQKYCKNDAFKRLFLEKSVILCPILVLKLYEAGVYRFDDIEPHFYQERVFILCYYFKKRINSFKRIINEKKRPVYFDSSYMKNVVDHNELFHYGFIRSSIEFCLKYDDIDALREHVLDINEKAQWSPFEWSYKPDSLDLLSFSGFFGSIRCFKYLLVCGFKMNKDVGVNIVRSGNMDLYHVFNAKYVTNHELISNSVLFCRKDILCYILDNEVDKDERIQLVLLLFFPVFRY